MLRFVPIFIALAPISCVQPNGSAQKAKDNSESEIPRHYECHFAKSPILIDGIPDESPWREANWSEFFVDIEGESKPRPRRNTNVKMIWDAKHLYVLAHLVEPHVWATLKNHDDIVFRDNDFEIFVDPDGDSLNYYEIEINALGTIFDLLLERTYRAGGPARHDWNLRGLQVAVDVMGTLNDSSDIDFGWNIEMALPWTSLAEFAKCASPPKVGDTWRMNFSRVEWQHELVDSQYRKIEGKPEDNWVWSPQGVIDMHLPKKWGNVTFVK